MGEIQLDSRVSSREYASSTSILEEARVYYMTILLNPSTFEVVSLDKRSALKFYLRGTCSTSKERKCDDIFCNFVDILSVEDLWPDIILRLDWRPIENHFWLLVW